MADEPARQLSDEISRWADGMWPMADQAAKLEKLGEEYGELAAAMVRGDPAEIVHEAADCMICLAHILHMSGCPDFLDVMRHFFEQRVARDQHLVDVGVRTSDDLR